MVLLDGVPGNGTVAATDEVAKEGSVLEEFERGTVGDGVAKLATQVCITESCKLMDI